MADPEDAFRTVFVLIGQPLIPWQHAKSPIAAAVGLVVVMVLVVSLSRRAAVGGTKAFVDDLKSQPLLAMTSLFAILFMVNRWVYMGSDAASEARYTPMSLVFLVSFFAYVYGSLHGRWSRLSWAGVCLLCALVAWRVGDGVAEDWMRWRSNDYNRRLSCWTQHPDSPLTLEHPCVKENQIPEMFQPDSMLRWMIQLKERRLSFFAHL